MVVVIEKVYKFAKKSKPIIAKLIKINYSDETI